MMEAFLAVTGKVAVILIFIVLGYITVRFGLFSQKGLSEITSLLLYVVTPCLIINSFLSAESGSLDAWSLFLGFALPAVSMFMTIAASYLFFKKEPPDRRKVLRFALIFCNVGFMGVPLVQGIVGAEGVLYSSFFIVVFNVISWTYGYTMMGGGKIRLKTLLLNPGVIGLVIGLPLYFFDVQLPELIASPIKMISDVNTPLAMIVVGGYIARVNWKEFISDLAVYKMAFLRLLVAPALYLAVALLIRPNDTLLLSSVIQAATPVAANTVLFAVQFNGDAALASKSIAVTTALSVITIPLFTLLTQAFM
ncbi:MAG: AEC family transporter [Clostridia bacterium]|nr:AEC family transporter [Clostridia bacterium]